VSAIDSIEDIRSTGGTTPADRDSGFGNLPGRLVSEADGRVTTALKEAWGDGLVAKTAVVTAAGSLPSLPSLQSVHADGYRSLTNIIIMDKIGDLRWVKKLAADLSVDAAVTANFRFQYQSSKDLFGSDVRTPQTTLTVTFYDPAGKVLTQTWYQATANDAVSANRAGVFGPETGIYDSDAMLAGFRESLAAAVKAFRQDLAKR
jgi:hypothetical protein